MLCNQCLDSFSAFDSLSHQPPPLPLDKDKGKVIREVSLSLSTAVGRRCACICQKNGPSLIDRPLRKINIDSFLTTASVYVELCYKVRNVLLPKSSVSPRCNVVCRYFPSITPAPQGIGMDVEEPGYFPYCQQRFYFVVTYHIFPFSLQLTHFHNNSPELFTQSPK